MPAQIFLLSPFDTAKACKVFTFNEFLVAKNELHEVHEIN